MSSGGCHFGRLAAPHLEDDLEGVRLARAAADAEVFAAGVGLGAAAVGAPSDELAALAVAAANRDEVRLGRVAPPSARRPRPDAAVEIVDAERALARRVDAVRRERSFVARDARRRLVDVAVLVRRVVRPLAGALELELRAQPLLLILAGLLGLGEREVRRRDRADLVGVRIEVDVEAVHHDLLAGHLLVGDARDLVGRRPGDQHAARDPHHPRARLGLGLVGAPGRRGRAAVGLRHVAATPEQREQGGDRGGLLTRPVRAGSVLLHLELERPRREILTQQAGRVGHALPCVCWSARYDEDRARAGSSRP